MLQGIRVLEGWVTVPVVAERLKLSKQGVHKRIEMGFQRDSSGPRGEYFTRDEVRTVGHPARPVILISEEAVRRQEFLRRENEARQSALLEAGE